MDKEKTIDKRIIIIPIIFFLIVAIVFFGYKLVMLNKYSSEEIEINKDAIFNETITINEEYNSEETSTHKDMTYGDFFSDYVDTDNNSFKVKRDLNNEVVSYYNIERERQYINLLNIYSFELFTEEEEKDYSTDISMKKFLSNNNINNDIDLLKYIKDNYYIKNSIFTFASNMKKNFIINTFVEVAFPNFNNIVLIDGNIKGYIINPKTNIKLKEIHLLNNDNQYVITLFGDEITNDEFINNLLKSIKFN